MTSTPGQWKMLFSAFHSRGPSFPPRVFRARISASQSCTKPGFFSGSGTTKPIEHAKRSAWDSLQPECSAASPPTPRRASTRTSDPSAAMLYSSMLSLVYWGIRVFLGCANTAILESSGDQATGCSCESLAKTRSRNPSALTAYIPLTRSSSPLADGPTRSPTNLISDPSGDQDRS